MRCAIIIIISLIHTRFLQTNDATLNEVSIYHPTPFSHKSPRANMTTGLPKIRTCVGRVLDYLISCKSSLYARESQRTGRVTGAGATDTGISNITDEVNECWWQWQRIPMKPEALRREMWWELRERAAAVYQRGLTGAEFWMSASRQREQCVWEMSGGYWKKNRVGEICLLQLHFFLLIKDECDNDLFIWGS